MKKLIAAAVIATAAFGAQQVSANNVDDVCQMQSMIVERAQQMARDGVVTKDEAQSNFAINYIKNTGSVNVNILSLTMGVIDAAYENKGADTFALKFAAVETCYSAMGGM